MSVNKQKVPKIRFEGFSEDWEQRKLGQLVLSLDAGVSVNSADDEVSNYWILKTSCITGGMFNENERKAVVDQNEILRLKEPLLSNSILMSRMNTPALVGISGYVDKATHNTFLPDRLWQFKLKEKKVDVRWLSNLFLTEKNLRIRQSNATGTSGSMKNISKVSVLQEEVFSTSLTEQTQIGNFFQQLDKLIELQIHAIESAETYKKAMLQKMFPQKGEKAPRVRFEGFSGDWEESYLGDITDIKTGKKDVQDALEYGVYPFYIRSDEVKRIDTYSFDGEAILIPGEGRLGEIFHYINGRFDYHQRVYKISDFINVNGLFVLSFMRQNFKRHALTYTVKATVDSLRLPIIQSFLIKHPSLDEQIQIGNFFKKLDQNIEAEKKKLEKYQDMKKAMLQRMFV